MCIIIVTEDGQIPHKEIRQSLIKNPDGYGYMFVRESDGQMIVRKGMQPKTFWKHWNKDRKDRAGRNLVFHARIGTSGEMDTRNCHPFPVNKGAKLWMAHNGVLSEHSYANSKKSDTRHFIEDVLRKLPDGWESSPAIGQLISGYVKGSKLVFMDESGEYSIFNEDDGHWKAGRWYSNYSYYVNPYLHKPQTPALYTPPSSLKVIGGKIQEPTKRIARIEKLSDVQAQAELDQDVPIDDLDGDDILPGDVNPETGLLWTEDDVWRDYLGRVEEHEEQMQLEGGEKI